MFHHLPDVQTLNGLLDLLSLCNLVVLGNVLDFRTYSAPNQGDQQVMTEQQKKTMRLYDRNNISKNERMVICYARGVALSIFCWVRHCASIKNPDGEVVHDLPSALLVQQLNALLTYKAAAMQAKLQGAPHCDTPSLRSQVLNVVQCDDLLKNFWLEKGGVGQDSLVFGSTEGYSVEWQPNVDPIGKHASNQ